MMGPAQQGQVVQVGRAAVQPVPQVMGFAPGQGPVTVGEHAAAVPHGQSRALGGGDDPAGPADVQGLAGGAAQDQGQQGRRCSQLGRQALVVVGIVVAPVAAGVVVARVAAGVVQVAVGVGIGGGGK